VARQTAWSSASTAAAARCGASRSTHFAQNGILVNPGSEKNYFAGNYLGTNPSGDTGFGNQAAGLAIFSNYNGAGVEPPSFRRNPISDWEGYFKLAPDAGLGGDAVRQAALTTCTADCNIISGNGLDGLLIGSDPSFGSTGNIVQRNWIGLGPNGRALANGQSGIRIRESTFNQIGGTASGEGTSSPATSGTACGSTRWPWATGSGAI
jgi:hypothetical protein